MKRFFNTIAAGIIAISATIAAPKAEAAQVAFDLTVTAAAGGLFEGLTGYGAVFFDEDLVPASGFASLSTLGEPGVTEDPTAGLFFDVGPYTFTEADAIAAPILNFFDGLLTSIDYIVTFASSRHDLEIYGVEQFTFLIDPPVRFDGTTYYVNALVKPFVSPVPLPAGLPLLAGGLGLLALMRRRAGA